MRYKTRSMLESRDEASDPAIVGDFAILGRLAAGGFGTVYRARDPSGAEVAVKVLRAQLAANPTTVIRFEREARAAASLAHPGIVKILADGQLADGRPWFAMELLRGRDLEHQLREHGRYSPDECIPVLRAVADALAAAHAHGIIHRDIKASNVFLAVDERGIDRVVLLDFGIAKLLDVDHELTATGVTIGTAASMAPEQSRGGPVDPRTDVYGLGAMLFHMLTGTKPFSGHETHELRFLNQHARRPRPSSRAALPPIFDSIVSKAMAIDPDVRYQTPRALADAFEHALAPAPEPAPARAAPVFLLAEISTIDDSLLLPTDDLWDDLEAVRAALEPLAQPPYRVHAVTDTSILVERTPDPATGERVAERVIDECQTLADRLRTRPTPHPAVRVRLTVDGQPPADEADPDPTEPVVVIVAPHLV